MQVDSFEIIKELASRYICYETASHRFGQDKLKNREDREMARRICIILGIILGVLWSCSKAPFPPEPDDGDVTNNMGKIYITTVDVNGLKIDQANIFVNGDYVGDTPLFIDSLFLGIHTIRVQKNGYFHRPD